MGQFGFADAVDLLNLTADVFGQLFGGLFALVIDFDFDK